MSEFGLERADILALMAVSAWAALVAHVLASRLLGLPVTWLAHFAVFASGCAAVAALSASRWVANHRAVVAGMAFMGVISMFEGALSGVPLVKDLLGVAITCSYWGWVARARGWQVEDLASVARRSMACSILTLVAKAIMLIISSMIT